MVVSRNRWYFVGILSFLLTACGGGGSGGSAAPAAQPPADDSGAAETGLVTVAITDGPMEDLEDLVFHLTHIDLGHADGQVTRLELPGGPQNVDMLELQNGVTRDLLDREFVPAGPYDWMELGIDFQQSHVGTRSGGRHGLQPGEENALRVHEPFEIRADEHAEFIMDFDLRRGIRHRHRGGMMGDRYEVHAGLRLMLMEDTGGLVGTVDASLVDINHPDCDPAIGGNWAYLFEGTAGQPDDFAESDTDGIPGPVATDRVELHAGVGEYRYHFAFIPAGTYRVAFTCSGEWDESGDDDYPSDPDGRFGFQAFSDPVDITAGEVRVVDLMP
jgi:hypothetical protein